MLPCCFKRHSRPHELLKLKIKDIVFKSAGNKQYAEVLVNGKTGSRHIPLIDSIPYLKVIPKKLEPAEIVAELRDCEEISKSLIYEYLDGKYKDPVHASKRKGKRKPVPETGTEPASEEKQKGIVLPLLIKKSASGLDVVDLTPEVNVAKTKVDADNDSNIDTHILQPQHKQSANTELGADSTMPQPQRTDTPTPVSTITTDHKDEKSQSYLLSHASDKQECPNLEFTILKEKYRIVRDAMDNSKASIVVKFDRNKNFLGAEPDVVFDISEANYQDGNVQQIQSDGVAKDKDKDDEHSNRHSNVRRKG